MDITLTGLTHRYKPKTPFERLALDDIHLSITSGSFLAIIGHTGSGKSTLIQHLNGLLKPSEGTMQVGNLTLSAQGKKQPLKELRRRVGIVFQYPEHQLFDETVEKDVMFGPMNFGVSEEQARQRAHAMIELVGLPAEVLTKSPFDLSGGQMRRVAIAGVLAMEPEVLVLDEPTAGLDPKGRREIMDLFYRLHKEKGLTTILVTHSMEDAAHYADRIVVMEQGRVYLEGTPSEVFREREMLQRASLDVPETLQFLLEWQQRSKQALTLSSFTIEDTARVIAQSFGEKGDEHAR
ncbi:cobalt transporter ATP-binding subunit [Fictibacillus macauensis ZFHKF-1]|uniref:Energy-coupling factor transporter ATP-binding protein EcfA2 n=1 Tax=Fictibacillus macauensis ZFHKF-1 TaxID=1196324 RepID=I8IX28_9BACL|nr:energy-coupling factor ABC transporter ATP-binding protein [Fictibacillus macauensis]EIT84026.1 cobalt transporter ATP-binding subunit [Fictibacillus macauensis ZFHKF-1]